MKYPHIAARIFNTPLLIHPQKLDAIVAGLGHRLIGAPVVLQGADAEATSPGLAPELFSTRRGERSEYGYQVVDGVAVVNIRGALAHRSRVDMDTSTYILGYNQIAAEIEDAMAHPDVHAVLQVWESPGGEAQGAFEFADRMFALRGKKPMHAIADGMAASAAFLGGSAAGELAVTATGYAGSIGVVMRHVDFSRALANEGIAVTHIFAGAHKVDGNPYEALPAAVRADFQDQINALYGMFVSAVSRNMGLTAEAIRATEARTFMGQAAVDAGLASRVTTTDALITELAGLRARSYPAGSARSSTAKQKGLSMSGTQPAADAQQPATTAAAVSAPSFTQADVDRARAEGGQAERTRVGAILGHPAAAANQALALQCINTGMTIEQSTAVLGAVPALQPAAQAGAPFAAAMAATGNPQVSGIEAGAAQNDEAALAASILANFSGKSAH